MVGMFRRGAPLVTCSHWSPATVESAFAGSPTCMSSFKYSSGVFSKYLPTPIFWATSVTPSRSDFDSHNGFTMFGMYCR